MFDNNFGYFGNGIEGYAHYMQSFNNNFSNDDNGFDSDDLYDDDLCYEDDYIKEDVQHSYKIALMCVKYIKEEITSFRDFVTSFLSVIYVFTSFVLVNVIFLSPSKLTVHPSDALTDSALYSNVSLTVTVIL